MDSDEEAQASKTAQIFAMKWIKQPKKTINIDNVKLSTKELKDILHKESNLSQSDEEVDENDTEEKNSDDNDLEEDTNAKANLSKNTEIDSKELEGLEEFNLEDYDDEQDFYVEKFSDFYMPDSDADSNYSGASESEDEKEALTLRKNDNMLICAKCKKSSNCLEVYVFNHESNDFYVHHHIDLYESSPICLQWLDFDAGFDPNDDNGTTSGPVSDKGSFIAVGTMESLIQIWDLNVVNQMEPDFVLGEIPLNGETSSKKYSHQDAVLDLAWCSKKRNKLVSASVDESVAVWDLEKGLIVRRYRNHKDKVQTVQYQPNSANNILSGAFNGTIFLFDTRKKSTNNFPSWKLEGEVERLSWKDEHYFAASTDTGEIHIFDIRQTPKSLFSWTAHEEAIPALSFQSDSQLYSSSTDGIVKLWDVGKTKATLKCESSPNIGMIYCMDFNPDVSSVMSIGGEKEGVRLMETDNLKTYHSENSISSRKKKLHKESLGSSPNKKIKKKN